MFWIVKYVWYKKFISWKWLCYEFLNSIELEKMKVFYRLFKCKISSWLSFYNNHAFDIIAPFIVHFWKKHWIFLHVVFVSMESFVFFQVKSYQISWLFYLKIVCICFSSITSPWFVLDFVYLFVFFRLCFCFFDIVFYFEPITLVALFYCCLKIFRTTHSLGSFNDSI